MANEFVQFRVDGAVKTQAADICGALGIDLSTYLRMCLTRLVRENGIPFSMRLEEPSKGERAIAALEEASETARRNGLSDMTMEEVDAEIAAARRERRAK